MYTYLCIYIGLSIHILYKCIYIYICRLVTMLDHAKYRTQLAINSVPTKKKQRKKKMETKNKTPQKIPAMMVGEFLVCIHNAT